MSLTQKQLKKVSILEELVHTGRSVSITIHPSKPIQEYFKRVDLKKNNIIIPNVFNVSNASFCTTVTNDYGVSVSTIEHLMGHYMD